MSLGLADADVERRPPNTNLSSIERRQQNLTNAILETFEAPRGLVRVLGDHMPKRSMVAIFGPELECVLFVAAPPLVSASETCFSALHRPQKLGLCVRDTCMPAG